MADDNLDSHKHRRKKSGGTPEWSETCLGVWQRKSKENSGKDEEQQSICRGISILHLNKYVDSKKMKHIPTQGIEIIIRDSDETSALHNLHPFLGIFADEQEVNRKAKRTERTSSEKPDEGEKIRDTRSDEATPKILHRVAENWVKRCHNVGQKLKKYYEDPASSTEIITEIRSNVSKSYATTTRILSYCHPQEKAKQVSSFVTERMKNLSKWWKE